MDFGAIDRVIARAGAQAVIEATASSITDSRRARIEHVLRGRIASIAVGVEHPEDPHNAAAIVRTAEALGAMHVHVIDADPRALDHRWVTQGAYHWVHTHSHPDFAAFERKLGCGADKLLLAGAVMNGQVEVEALPVDRPLCILFGNEGNGLSEQALAACDLTFRVPMFGMSESLNLSVSAAITLQSLLRRRRVLLGAQGELQGASYLREKARYYGRSVELRLLEACFGASDVALEAESP